MKIAIMQPYFFPYIGYFQLIKAVDKFVFYDDVSYIKGGWISRNRIMVNNNSHYFSIPLDHKSPNKPIKETMISKRDYKTDLIKTLEFNYKKAPYFTDIFLLIKKIMDKEAVNISDLAINSVIEVCNYLGITTSFVFSSAIYNNSKLKGKDRLIDICKKEHASEYINAAGGKKLYLKKDFLDYGIKLKFIELKEITYNQFGKEFIPWLSIIDVLMFNNKEEIIKFLDMYSLI